MNERYLSWLGIVRLGLVQTALGSVVVLATSIMNRVMVVELALPALIPGALVAIHYAIQLLRPRIGYGSDRGGHHSRFILLGVAVLGLGAILAAIATSLMASQLLVGIVMAVVGFVMIGAGVGAAGTCLLVLLAKRSAPAARPIAATVVWLMMIAGFVITTICAGRALEPYSSERLIEVTTVVAAIALVMTALALIGMDKTVGTRVAAATTSPAQVHSFRAALLEAWADTSARRLAIFIFVSMLAYSAEELILDPFAGSVFGLTPGQSTQLSGALHGGVFVGMLVTAILSSSRQLARHLTMHRLMVAGCVASALALTGLAASGLAAPAWPLRGNVFILGLANGIFAVSALGSMMTLAGAGGDSREGVRMGLWGAAQGVAFGCGGVLGAGASDIARLLFERRGPAYTLVFLIEAGCFIAAALVAMQMGRPQPRTSDPRDGRIGPLSLQ